MQFASNTGLYVSSCSTRLAHGRISYTAFSPHKCNKRNKFEQNAFNG